MDSTMQAVLQFVEENDLKIAAVFLTHGHGDHTKGAEAVKAQYHCPIVCGKEEAETLSDKVLNFNDMFGIRQPVVPDILLQDGEVFSFAKRSLRAIATPGHTIGGMCFYDEEAGILFAGDSLFLESIDTPFNISLFPISIFISVAHIFTTQHLQIHKIFLPLDR